MFKYCLRLQGGGKGLKVGERACKKGTAHTHTHTYTFKNNSRQIKRWLSKKKFLKCDSFRWNDTFIFIARVITLKICALCVLAYTYSFVQVLSWLLTSMHVFLHVNLYLCRSTGSCVCFPCCVKPTSGGPCSMAPSRAVTLLI